MNGALVDFAAAHEALAPEVRDAAWTSNCAGEIFVEDGTERGLRIGHFQGDSMLASFVVIAHETTLRGVSRHRRAGKSPSDPVDFESLEKSQGAGETAA